MKFTNSSSDANDGVLGTGIFAPGLNIVGINTDSTYRKVAIWGQMAQQENAGTNSWIGTNYFSGNVGIGISPSYALDVYKGSNANAIHAASVSGGACCGYAIYAENGSNNAGLGRGDGYAFVGTGNVWATGAGTFNQSDARLKENIHTINDGLETLLKLRPVTFQWKKNSEAYNSAGSTTQFGLIAQEVKKVVPEVVILNRHPPVSPRKDGTQSLDAEIGESYGVEYTKIIPFLIRGAQELKVLCDGIAAQTKALAFRADQQSAKLAEDDKKIWELHQENAALRSAVCAINPKPSFCALGAAH
jgi:hypothetical protein